MAKGPQGWVQCEDHLPYYKDSPCSLPLLLKATRACITPRGARGLRPRPSPDRQCPRSWVPRGPWRGRALACDLPPPPLGLSVLSSIYS
jgi:hypothetical protein